MNFSRPFIERPIGTTLLAIGLFLSVSWLIASWPVASLPSVEFPTISVTASRPGADPATMAATIAAPLERRLGEIAGVNGDDVRQLARLDADLDPVRLGPRHRWRGA